MLLRTHAEPCPNALAGLKYTQFASMNQTRRDLGILLPALLAAAGSQAKQSPSSSKPLLRSKTYEYTDLPVITNPQNHAESRHVFDGLTHAGVPVEAHITLLPPGQMPHPAHHHEWEEILYIQTGKIQVTINGETTQIGPGSVVYIASNEEHSSKNIGDVPSQYFVLAIGHYST
jgi:mannose-6-phosphate isomerase-like protein (cupin superfamily)